MGIHIVSMDDMTGIRALEHKYPDKLPLPGTCATMVFGYIPHETTRLIGCFDIARRKIHPPYLNKTRTEADFCQAICEVVETEPENDWVFVLRWPEYS